MKNNEWSSAPIYFGGDGTPQLIFIGDDPVAYFKREGGRQALFVSQGMNRQEFKANLLAKLPSFCEEYGITDKTLDDIFTKRELEREAITYRANAFSRLNLENREKGELI